MISTEAAALQAAQILALSDHMIWARLRVCQLKTLIGLVEGDRAARKADQKADTQAAGDANGL